ncbi:MAG: phage major capsid protein [Atopobium minutum]|uniref:Phage major capsid protein, HK97 family n=1 Tax=Atopobium minutum TaxID=1381 RepID=A0AB38A4T5_9ACTN|nr:phage major capsid protein [Atopobium minutum]KRN55045.1 hypothetical protein IV72_GL000543 [Atopobium minutum]MBS4873949.1 phage major capsid protein [Atopobium minutum]SEB43717.1 phage major capsid protein, HK97 family [Atopobium minutum]
MSIFNSKQLWNERKRLEAEQAKAVTDQKLDEARIIEGQIKQIDLTLEQVLNDEQEARNVQVAPAPRQTLGERVLGARDEFTGLAVGFRNDVTVTHLGTPTETDYELPANGEPLLNNFANTLIEVPASGSINYMQRIATTGKPDTWGGVTNGTSAVKAKVIYNFKQAVANKETVAGYSPISKDSLRDYDSLMSIINNDLVLDVQISRNAKYLNGNNNTGIIGVTNTAGILSFTEHMGKNYYDAIRMMRTKVMSDSRRVPTHVCINPLIKEAIDLYKTKEGLYQTLGTDTIWGMSVVEDVDCDGILVYNANSARARRIGNGMTVEVGYVNDQFIKNELCILAETDNALQVNMPSAFCYATKTDLDTK